MSSHRLTIGYSLSIRLLLHNRRPVLIYWHRVSHGLTCRRLLLLLLLIHVTLYIHGIWRRRRWILIARHLIVVVRWPCLAVIVGVGVRMWLHAIWCHVLRLLLLIGELDWLLSIWHNGSARGRWHHMWLLLLLLLHLLWHHRMANRLCCWHAVRRRRRRRAIRRCCCCCFIFLAFLFATSRLILLLIVVVGAVVHFHFVLRVRLPLHFGYDRRRIGAIHVVFTFVVEKEQRDVLFAHVEGGRCRRAQIENVGDVAPCLVLGGLVEAALLSGQRVQLEQVKRLLRNVGHALQLQTILFPQFG